MKFSLIFIYLRFLVPFFLLLSTSSSFSQIEIRHIDSLINKGNYHMSLDNYNKAIRFYQQSLEYSTTVQSNYGLYLSNLNLANAYNNWGENNSALHYYKESLNAAKFAKNNKWIAGALNNIGQVYSDITQYDSALFFYKKAYIHYKLTDDTVNTAGVLNNIGTVYTHQQKNVEKGILYFKKAYKIAKQTKDNKLKALLTINLANNYKRRYDYKNALKYINKSAQYTKDLDSKLFIMRIEKSFAETYDSLKDYSKAFSHFKNYHKLQKEIFNKEKHKQFAEIKTKFETEKKEQEIKTLNKSRALDQERIKKQQILIFSFVSLLILVALVLSLLFRQSKLKSELLLKDKQKLKLEKNNLVTKIEHKEREMATTTMHLVQKNELLQKLKGKIDKITSERFNIELNNLSKDINSNINIEKDWQTFKIHFEEVNPIFFNTLTNHHSRLSQNDLRICAYIKIGLSNKEIAQMLNILPESVKSTKKRIKKKLALSSQDNLSSFIKSI